MFATFHVIHTNFHVSTNTMRNRFSLVYWVPGFLITANSKLSEVSPEALRSFKTFALPKLHCFGKIRTSCFRQVSIMRTHISRYNLTNEGFLKSLCHQKDKAPSNVILLSRLPRLRILRGRFTTSALRKGLGNIELCLLTPF